MHLITIKCSTSEAFQHFNNIKKMDLPIIQEIRKCTVCEPDLPMGANPIVTAIKETKIGLISQAPGRIAHVSDLAWNDPSGRRLREWLNVTDPVFYDPKNFGVLPMGFCYPGKGKSGDLPPRKECAPLWHEPLLAALPNIEIFLLIGAYSQKYYLGKTRKKNLTETVRAYEEYLPRFFPLVHPSPLNFRWQKKNPWYEAEVVPDLQERIKNILPKIE